MRKAIFTMEDKDWNELKAATLKQWLSQKHPSTLRAWEEGFAGLLDLDVWLKEYRPQIYQKFLVGLEKE